MSGDRVSTADAEKQWRFTPQSRGVTGEYQLVVDTAIEDFRREIAYRTVHSTLMSFDHVTQHITKKTISLPFTVR